MIFVYNERQGVRDGQTVMASCLYIYGDRSAHGMRSLFIVYNILYAEMENSVKHKNFHTQKWRITWITIFFHTFRTGKHLTDTGMRIMFLLHTRMWQRYFSDFVKSAEGHIYLSDYDEERLYFQGRFQGQSFPGGAFLFRMD